MSKPKEKEKAIKLRKKGYSYSEILKEVSVAKSTLSLWLRSVGLAKRQKQRLTNKKIEAQKRGARFVHERRKRITEEIKGLARKDVNEISRKELWLIGTVLYWAEGAKQKPSHVSARISLGNSDPEIIRIFIKWLYGVFELNLNDLEIRLYIHKTGDEIRSKKYWSKITKIPVSNFYKTVFKKHSIKTNRRFDNKNYYGLLSISVKRSTNLNRRISGWIEGICENV